MLRLQIGHRPVGRPMVLPPPARPRAGIRIAKGIVKTTPKLMRWGWARRRPLAPIYAAAALQLGGAVMAAVPQGGRTACVLGLFGGLGLRVWIWWRGHTGRGLGRRKVGYVAVVYAASIVWLVTAAAWGAGPPMPGVLLILMAAGGVPWWWHHRIRPTHRKPHELLDPWQAEVSPKEGALPGAVLINPRTIDNGGSAATIDLSGTCYTADDAVARLPQITAAYRKPRGSVVVERTAAEYEHQAELLVLDRNPTHEIIEYDQTWQILEDGCVPIGIYPDGHRGWTRIFQPRSGTVHELYAGDSGSGKSRGVELSILQSAATGLVVPWVGDPQGGQSIPAWAGAEGKSPYAATTPEEILEQLFAVRRIMYARSRELARTRWKDEDGITRRGLDFYDPQTVPWMPILELTIDEAHRILDDDDGKAVVEEVIVMARKTGIRLRLATQHPELRQLGSSMVIRNQLTGGNVVSYRISGTQAKQMILPSWLPSPATIPKRLPTGEHSKGMCVVDTTAPGSSRGTFMRTAWARRGHYWADQVAAKIPLLDEVSLQAWHNGSTPEKATATSNPAPTPVSTRERVVEYLRNHDGPVRTGVIAAALEVPLATASTTLGRLAQAGHVQSVRRGEWIATRQLAAA